MKNSYKIANIALLVLLALTAGVAYLYWGQVCTGDCSHFTVRGVLSPLLWGSFGFSFSVATLLLFSFRIFKHWLIGVFSWFLPASVLLINAIDIRDSAFLAMTRDDTAWALALLLYIITAIFIVVDSLWQYWAGRFSKRDLLWLLWLVPITAAMSYVFDVSLL